MNPQKRSSRKKTLKLKDLKTTKDPRAGGGVKPSRPSRDGLNQNHNEMFLADVS